MKKHVFVSYFNKPHHGDESFILGVDSSKPASIARIKSFESESNPNRNDRNYYDYHIEEYKLDSPDTLMIRGFNWSKGYFRIK